MVIIFMKMFLFIFLILAFMVFCIQGLCAVAKKADDEFEKVWEDSKKIDRDRFASRNE